MEKKRKKKKIEKKTHTCVRGKATALFSASQHALFIVLTLRAEKGEKNRKNKSKKVRFLAKCWENFNSVVCNGCFVFGELSENGDGRFCSSIAEQSGSTTSLCMRDARGAVPTSVPLKLKDLQHFIELWNHYSWKRPQRSPVQPHPISMPITTFLSATSLQF